MTVKTKLTGAFSLVVALMMVVGAISYMKLSALSATIDEVIERAVKRKVMPFDVCLA